MLRSGIRYLEVDTRVTADGVVFIYHDPKLRRDVSGRGLTARMSSQELRDRAFSNGDNLMDLDYLLERFAADGAHDTVLCLDIKDYGYEEIHLNAVRKYSLESRVVFVSWIPQTIRRLAELDTTSPLVLSHLNTSAWKRRGWLLENVSRRMTLRFGRFVLIGKSNTSSDLNTRAHGFQHAVLCTRLPSDMEGILRVSKGGIAVSTRHVTEDLKAYCRDKGLRLWVFSVDSIDQFIEYAADENIDVVFCNDALAVQRWASGNACENIEDKAPSSAKGEQL